ncbi:hypothetical protein Acsp02_17000 [Actinoplanes sp. NBRC 103695]|nr:hypothetical protein Acsp02_17000 [Actinoplanes sp. NBRC 103695]
MRRGSGYSRCECDGWPGGGGYGRYVDIRHDTVTRYCHRHQAEPPSNKS